MHFSAKLLASTARRIFGSALLVLGLVGVLCAGLWQLELLPGSRIELPAPVAFQGLPGVSEVHAPLAALGPVTRSPGKARQLPDVAPRMGAHSPLTAPVLPGVAQRLVIASIDLDTPVVAGGIRTTPDGAPEWETVPNIAVHYAELTALIGAPGNAVVAGHVSTRAEGNVFLNLYRVQLGDEVRVWDEQGALHVFGVVSVQLVPPSNTSVMQPTADPTLTLLTCAGSFDPVRREFSDRLVVTAIPSSS